MDNRKLEEDNYNQYTTPTSTLSSGFGNYYGGFRHEDNLPEVSVDQSPQALSNPEAEFKRKYFEESEPKYPVIYDHAPKAIVLENSIPSASPTMTTTAVERAPDSEQSPVEERKICGLKRRMFFIVLVVVLVIIAIAVGGGVGGAMSSKSKSKSKTSADPASTVSTSSEALSKYGSIPLPTRPR